MSPIRFARESLTDALWSEALPLLTEHWREVAHFADIPLNPDVAAYAASQAAGHIRCYTARDDDGDLAGYALYFVRPNPHYSQSIQAAQDVIYVAPWARGSTGYKFIAFCDQQLATEGVQAVYHHVKTAHNFGKMLERQGYEAVDIIYAKRLDVSSAVPAVAAAMADDVRTIARAF